MIPRKRNPLPFPCWPGRQPELLYPLIRQDTAHMSTLTTKLRDLNEKIAGIRREQQYQREIESVFRDASERVNKRAMWWSFIQMAVLLAAGAWQMRHLKVSFAGFAYFYEY